MKTYELALRKEWCRYKISNCVQDRAVLIAKTYDETLRKLRFSLKRDENDGVIEVTIPQRLRVTVSEEDNNEVSVANGRTSFKIPYNKLNLKEELAKLEQLAQK